MRIIGRDRKLVHACCQFEYKGYIVSVTTLLSDYPEVAVFDSMDKGGYEKYDFYNVEEAIEHINNL